MRPLWRFIRNKNNREMIGWLGGGLVILATGAWALFTYVYPPAGPSKPAARVEARDGSIAIGGNVEGSTIGVNPSPPVGQETPAPLKEPGR
jgi:hypothetical protein